MNQHNSIDINKVIAKLVEDNATKFVDKLSKTIKKERNRFLIDFKFSFSKYLDNAYTKYSKIKTFLHRIEPKYIYDFFEPGSLRYKDKLISSADVREVLNISRYLIIQGTGGIGKTTLMKHFFINSIISDELIPLFFELRDLNEKDGDIISCMYQSFSTLGFNLDIDMFEYALKCGNFMILLDGYDEINTNKFHDTLHQIDALCDKYPDNYYIISSRPYDSFVSLQRFTVLDTCLFNKEQAVNLVRKIDYDSAIKDRFINDLENKLYVTHESFASNPLLLNIMLLTYDNYAEIPEKLHLFYSNAFDTMFSKHDATKGYKREMKSNLSYDNFKRVFTIFSFNTYLKIKYEFTYNELLDNLNIIMKKSGIAFNPIDYVQDLIYSVCLLYRDGQSYHFTHRSFQEYFTAVYVKDLDDELQTKISKYLIVNIKATIREDKVFDMLFDMNQERFERNVMIPLLDEIEVDTSNNFISYYERFITRIGVQNKVEDTIYLSRFVSSSKLVEEFLFSAVYKYYNEYLSSYNQFDIHELKEYVRLKFNEEEDFSIGLENKDILEDENLINYISKSWIGARINTLMNLRKILHDRQKKYCDDIFELLG